jgi:hypothetical protein
MDQVPEECLRAGEHGRVNHHHHEVEITEESLLDHLATRHATAMPETLSFGALRGIHDRFHGEAHATDD